MSASHSTKPWPELPVSNKDLKSAAVVIIGAGMSGMCTAIDLIKNHNIRNFIILEKSNSVGGTWSDNKYPGCCCDVWSLLYSYSFEQNPDWSREYPGQEEILDYLVRTASKYELYRYIRFNSSVDSATWDDEAKQWNTQVRVTGEKQSEYQDTYTIRSDYLVSAVGQLNVPKTPSFEGIDEFQGKIMHSARWDWSYDLRDMKIAVIGSGATAAQIVPEVAKYASKLTVYQRTPAWIIPRLDADVPQWKKNLYRLFPPAQWRVRAAQMDFRESFFEAVGIPGSAMENILREQCLQQMHAALPDQPDLWEKLTPNYHVGCKRVVISDDYYPTLARSNVRLETKAIARLAPGGIAVTDDAGVEAVEDFDLIVFATGFRTTQFMHPIQISGRNGKPLSSVWSEGAMAYQGVTVADLPNFGMLYGPNTNLGHNSIVLMMEAQSRYINAMIRAVLEARGTRFSGTNGDEKVADQSGYPLSLVPKQGVVNAYNARVQSELGKSAFADPNCSSWYKDPKTGRITNNWSRTVIDYQKMLSEVNWEDYEDGEEVVKLRNGEKKGYLGRIVEETQVSNTALIGMSIAAVVAGWLAKNHHVVSNLLK